MRWSLAASLAALTLAGCGGDEKRAPRGPAGFAEAGAHVHGLGIDPASGSLYIATHTGLFRAAENEPRASRVADRYQDTMGFTVTGPNQFLGSGHPDTREDLPPLLGLIRSEDAGRTWQPVSLLGEADFHVLRAAGARIYGFDATQGRLMVSSDAGLTWDERRPPAPLLDLAIDPEDDDRILATSEQGVTVSRDAGETWRMLDSSRIGLLVWTQDGVTLVDGSGVVERSADAGSRWRRVGDIGGQPAALAADGPKLYVALHTNEIKVSSDGGRAWTTRVPAE